MRDEDMIVLLTIANCIITLLMCAGCLIQILANIID